MLLGVIGVAVAIAGIVYGAMHRRRLLILLSAVALAAIIAVWAFFWFNPY